MRSTVVAAWVLAIVHGPVLACVDLSDREADAGVRVVAATVILKDVITSAPLEGVEMCETGTNNCARSGANGDASIDLPMEMNTSYTFQKDGYPTYLIPHFVRSSTVLYTLPMFPDARAAELHGFVMARYPMVDTGTIRLVLEPTLPGATFSLLDGAGVAFYDDEEDNWSPDLFATTEIREGGFAGVAPGEYTITFGGAAQQCIHDLAWPGPEENTVRVPVLEGHLTLVVVNCFRP